MIRGGDVVYAVFSGDAVHVFKSDGFLTVVGEPIVIEMLVVTGGGGDGGAGVLIHVVNLVLTPGVHRVSVGQGCTEGAGGFPGTAGQDDSNSSFYGFEAVGDGGGSMMLSHT